MVIKIVQLASGLEMMRLALAEQDAVACAIVFDRA